jgi:serine/threonine protein phosphatase PrpC
VGDTRIYRLHPHALEQLTEDHRVRLSPTESLPGPGAGHGPHVEIDYQHWTVEVGEVYLLATDGAYEFLDAAACTPRWPQHATTWMRAAQAWCSGAGNAAARQHHPAAGTHRRAAEPEAAQLPA